MFGFAEEDVEVIRKSLMPAGANEADLKLFLAQAHRSKLDPLSRQIYATGFKEKDRQGNYTGGIKLQVGITIDGFRVIAERTGKYSGQEGPYWCGPDGEWKDVWLAKGPPTACKVGVLRSDFQQTLWAVANFAGYSQGQGLWNRIPEQMIAKCAEMLALRKAFPNDLGGLYGKEELGDVEEQVVPSSPSIQQADTGRKETPIPEKQKGEEKQANREGNKTGQRQKSANDAPKQEAAQGGKAVPGESAAGKQQASAEDKARPEGGLATAPAEGARSDTGGAEPGAATTSPEPAADPTVTAEELMGLLNHGVNNGFAEEEISAFIEETFKLTDETILEMKKSQLGQAKHHFTRKKI